MEEVSQQIIIDATPAECFAVITDYAAYRVFLPAVHEVEILRRENGFSLVRFELDLFFRLNYTLRIIEEPVGAVHWSLENSSVFTQNDGGWLLENTPDGHTAATYKLNVAFKGTLPPVVTNKLINDILPKTLAIFRNVIEAAAEGKKNS